VSGAETRRARGLKKNQVFCSQQKRKRPARSPVGRFPSALRVVGLALQDCQQDKVSIHCRFEGQDFILGYEAVHL
jgi:hypothetical protein